MNEGEILAELAAVLRERRCADPAESYVAALYAGGVELMAAKISEEAAEVVAAARTEGDQALIHESADLWFHTLVLLCHKNIAPQAVLAELRRRFGRSGLEEKAGRGK